MIDRARYYMRPPGFLGATTSNEVLVIDPAGEHHDLATIAVEEWSALFQELIAPITGDVLVERLSHLPDSDRDFASLLIDTQLLLEATTPRELLIRRQKAFTDNRGLHLDLFPAACKHLILALTGSIMSGLMAPIALSLAYCGIQGQLDVLLTSTALKFTTRDLYESYGIRTWVDPFERRDDIFVPHVHLAQSADCVLVMPASANSLHRLATGTCSDLLAMVVSATDAPVVAMPVMNDAMWNHKAVQRNVTQLRDDGVYIIEPGMIVAASALIDGADPMYGGPGSLWRGPIGAMHTVAAVVDHHRSRKQSP